jgi:hypothetical protein
MGQRGLSEPSPATGGEGKVRRGRGVMRGRGATGRDRKGPGDGAATWRGAGRVSGCAGWGGRGGRGGQSGQSCARESPQRSPQTHPSIEPRVPPGCIAVTQGSMKTGCIVRCWNADLSPSTTGLPGQSEPGPPSWSGSQAGRSPVTTGQPGRSEPGPPSRSGSQAGRSPATTGPPGRSARSGSGDDGAAGPVGALRRWGRWAGQSPAAAATGGEGKVGEGEGGDDSDEGERGDGARQEGSRRRSSQGTPGGAGGAGGAGNAGRAARVSLCSARRRRILASSPLPRTNQDPCLDMQLSRSLRAGPTGCVDRRHAGIRKHSRSTRYGSLLPEIMVT